MEPRSKSEASDTRGSVNQELTANSPTRNLSHLPYIEETIARGGITIGTIRPVKECVAIAHEGKTTLAMLKRRKGESVAELLTRLDHAIGLAHTEDIFTDEINAKQPSSTCHPSISRRPKADAYICITAEYSLHIDWSTGKRDPRPR